jgi:hypothetical protein
LTKRKPKSLYVEGFLCLFDDRGDIVYRPKTKLEDAHYYWNSPLSRSIVEAESPYYTIGDDGCPIPHGDHCDVPTLLAWNDIDTQYEFVGHFDIVHHGKAVEFGFGEGRMNHGANCDPWDYEFLDLEIDQSFFKLVRVTLE